MPFRYEPLAPNLYAQSIASLMEHEGDIQATKAIDIAAAEARAQEIGSSAMGQAISNVGQIAGKTIEQTTSPEAELNRQQVQYAKSQLLAKKATSQLVAKYTNPDGTYNRDAIASGLTQLGIPVENQAETMKALDSVDESRNKLQQHRQEGLADTGNFVFRALKALPTDASPEARLSVAASGVAAAQHAGFITGDQGAKFLADLQAKGVEPMSVALAAMGASPSKKYAEELKSITLPPTPRGGSPAQVIGPAGNVTATGAPAQPAATTETDLKLKAGRVGTPQEQPGDKEAQAALRQGSEFLPKPETGVVFVKNGKEVTPVWNPSQQRFEDPETHEQVSVRPKTPASVIVQNQVQSTLANLPEWVTSADRPSGPDANKIDPKVGTSPNGLYQDAITQISTGQYPPTGMGSSPAAQAKRASIDAKVGAIAAAAGMDVPSFRAAYKANQGSLVVQQKAADAVQAFMATADKNTVLLKETLKTLPDIGSPIFNKPLRAFAKDVSGDPNLSKFATYMQSVQNEYARIITQPTLAGQLTDSARREAENLIDPKATVPQIVESIKALSAEGSNRLLSISDQIQRIQQRIAAPAAPPSSGAEPITIGRFQVQTQ